MRITGHREIDSVRAVGLGPTGLSLNDYKARCHTQNLITFSTQRDPLCLFSQPIKHP